MKRLKLAEGLELPAETAATQVYAYMGRRGSGKTYGAGRLVEQLVEHGYQVCVVDPVGTWWGLRLAADGKSKGLDVPVFGGLHGDLPLPAHGGKVFGEMVASRSSSVVLDVSDMIVTEQRRFVGDFAADLFQAKKRNKSPLAVVVEECQEFMPQHVMGEQAKMLSHLQRLVKLGRNYGVGVVLISQRPQAVNKECLNQTELMMAFQLTGPQERKAIDGWVQEVGAGDREIADELPGLKNGTAICWSPSWLQHFGRHKVLPKWTYDASATPEHRKAEASKTLPAIDLEELRKALAAASLDVADNDPKELKGEVGRLRVRLRSMEELVKMGVASKAPPIEWVVESVPPEVVERSSALIGLLDRVAGIQGALDREVGLIKAEAVALLKLGHRRPHPNASQRIPATANGKPAEQARILDRSLAAAPAGARAHLATMMAELSGPVVDSGRSGAPARMLRALASRHPEPCSKRQVATLAGVAPRTSTFRGGMAELSKQGLIDRQGDMVSLTAEGLRIAGGAQAPKTPAELLAMWMGELSGKARDMLELLATEGRPFKKADIATRLNLDPRLSTFRGYMAQLSLNDLIRKTNGGFVINPELAQ